MLPWYRLTSFTAPKNTALPESSQLWPFPVRERTITTAGTGHDTETAWTKTPHMSEEALAGPSSRFRLAERRGSTPFSRDTSCHGAQRRAKRSTVPACNMQFLRTDSCSTAHGNDIGTVGESRSGLSFRNSANSATCSAPLPRFAQSDPKRAFNCTTNSLQGLTATAPAGNIMMPASRESRLRQAAAARCHAKNALLGRNCPKGVVSRTGVLTSKLRAKISVFSPSFLFTADYPLHHALSNSDNIPPAIPWSRYSGLCSRQRR